MVKQKQVITEIGTSGVYSFKTTNTTIGWDNGIVSARVYNLKLCICLYSCECAWLNGVFPDNIYKVTVSNIFLNIHQSIYRYSHKAIYNGTYIYCSNDYMHN
jgi:hypothetical protein